MSNASFPVFLYISMMPVASVLALDLCWLERRKICLLVLGLLLLVLYCMTFSKSVFDFSKTTTITISQAYHLASQGLTSVDNVQGEREMERERHRAEERTGAAQLRRL